MTVDDLRQADNLDEFNRLSDGVRKQGESGIPIFLAVIEESLQSKYDVFSYGKLNATLLRLHELAKAGVHTAESVPVLVRAITEQTAIADTLMTAEILTMITGIDPGYDREFVVRYTESDEPTRQCMISRWREWQIPQTESE